MVLQYDTAYGTEGSQYGKEYDTGMVSTERSMAQGHPYRIYP